MNQLPEPRNQFEHARVVDCCFFLAIVILIGMAALTVAGY